MCKTRVEKLEEKIAAHMMRREEEELNKEQKEGLEVET